MTDERAKFLSDVAFKVAAEARSASEIFDILFSHGILAEDEMTLCLVAALTLNSFELGVALSQLKSVKEADLTQGDEILLN